VARIEGDPTAISVEQLIEVLAALNVRLVLRDAAGPPGTDATPVGMPAPAKKRLKMRSPADSDW